jgi:hypothetical protein
MLDLKFFRPEKLLPQLAKLKHFNPLTSATISTPFFLLLAVQTTRRDMPHFRNS